MSTNINVAFKIDVDASLKINSNINESLEQKQMIEIIFKFITRDSFSD
jgi:hypothetical protein